MNSQKKQINTLGTRSPLFSGAIARLILALWTLLVLAAPGLAQADDHLSLSAIARGNSFGKGFSQGIRSKMVKEVPLVAMDGARVVMANYQELNRLGVKTPKNGLRDGKFESQITKSFAFRPATPEEIAANKHTHVGLATRYADALGSKGVKGDGRAALTGEVVVKNRKGHITGVYDIQVKGVGTGLHPDWNGFSHRHGKESLRQAMEDALFSDYLARNGLRTNKWLAVIDTGDYINHPNGGKERAGLLVRGGNFLRLAHFNLMRNDPKGLRELVDFANKQVSVEMGRSRALSIPGLYKVLTQRKAKEVANNFWLRTVHGSTTYDNIGLIENMDHGTASTVDRSHRNYSFFSKWVGYGGEAKFTMQQYYEKELYTLLMKAASPQEQAQLKKLKPGRISQGMLDQQMTYQSLLHVGFSEKDAGRVMKRHRKEAKNLMKVVLSIADTVEPGATHKMGRSGKTQVKDPARFDIFRALNKLPELQLSHKDPDARAKALVSILRPGKAGTPDLAAARELVTAFDKVINPVLKRVNRKEVEGRVRLMSLSAKERNRHAVDLVRQDLRDYSISMTSRITKGENLDGIRADLNAFRRNNVVHGKGSAVYAASRLMAGKARKTSDGLVVLSSHRENGVSIKEVSDGKKDFIRVSIAGDPLKLADAGRYKMRVKLGNGQWQDVTPTKVTGDKASFDLHVISTSAPQGIQAAFYDGRGQVKGWWNNSGRDFGRNIRLVLGNDNVQTALAVEAQRRGGQRSGMKSSLQAVAQSLFRNEKSRAASKGQPKAKKQTQRTPRHQRSLLRALSSNNSGEKFHTYKLKPGKVRKVSKVRKAASKPRVKNTVRQAQRPSRNPLNYLRDRGQRAPARHRR